MLKRAKNIQKCRLLFGVAMVTSLMAVADPPAKEKPASAARSEKKAAAKASPGAKESWTQKATKGEEVYVHMKTSLGDIVLKLFSKEAPKTVANFVGLATGEKKWTNPATGKEESKPLYNGTLFHRVIPGFMVQGGDPLGRGVGGPGYNFEDEFQSGLKFDKPGLLAMANRGPNTNGSQFFITVEPTPHLNNRHTIFGEVVQGFEVVQKIANAPRDSNDRPSEEVRIIELKLSSTATPPAK